MTGLNQILLRFTIAALLPFIAGVIISRGYTGEPKSMPIAQRRWALFRACCFYAALIGMVGAFVPAIWWPWFHLICVPPTTILLCGIACTISASRTRFNR